MIPTPELDFWPLLPELCLVASGIIGMLFEAFSARSPRPVHLAIALAGLLGASVAAMLYIQATPVPIAIRVNMLRWPLFTEAQPRSKNGQPAHRTTGVARTIWIRLAMFPSK